MATKNLSTYNDDDHHGRQVVAMSFNEIIFGANEQPQQQPIATNVVVDEKKIKVSKNEKNIAAPTTTAARKKKN